MLTVDKNVFFKVFNDTNQPSLRPAIVVTCTADGYAAQLYEDEFTVPMGEESDLIVDAGQEVLLYYERKRVFVKQAVLIEGVSAKETTIVRFKLQGPPESAENRECYRVSTVIGDLSAFLGEEEDCKVLDISVNGFSVVAKNEYKPEDVVEVTLRYQGKAFSGQARIQSIRPWHEGQVRYGLCSCSPNEVEGQLHRGMKEISMQMERQQLSRLSAVS